MKIAFIGPKWNAMVNAYPSLGLAYLAAVAEQGGHEARIFDFGLRPQRPLEDDVQDVIDFKPDLVALTSMTTSYASVEQAAAILKEALGVTTIIGGPHATTLPDMTLQDPNIDYLIYGEGEETFRDFLQALDGGASNWGDIEGLWYKQDGRVIDGGERALKGSGCAPVSRPPSFRSRPLSALRPQRRAYAHSAEQSGLSLQLFVLFQGHCGSHLSPAQPGKHRRRVTAHHRKLRRAQLLLHR